MPRGALWLRISSRRSLYTLDGIDETRPANDTTTVGKTLNRRDAVIKKVSGGYKVVSEDGKKNLGGPIEPRKKPRSV
jgi:hypothetical protein